MKGRTSPWRKRERRSFFAFLIPSLLGVFLFVLLPFGDVVKRSFTTAVSGKYNGIQNYTMIFKNQAFRLAVANTFRFTIVCIPLLVLIGFILAYAMAGLKRAQMIKSVYLFPLAMPTATVVLVWRMVFARQGFLNMLLTALGDYTGLWSEVHKDYLGSSAAFWVLVGSYLWKNTGYTIVLWLAGIFSIPTDILDAAKVDGAGKGQRIRYIILPNLKGSLFTIVVLSFLNSFKIYREAYLVAGAYPDQSMYLLQHLFNNWFVNLEFDKMAAAAVCTGVFLFAVIMLFLRLWDRGEE